MTDLGLTMEMMIVFSMRLNKKRTAYLTSPSLSCCLSPQTRNYPPFYRLKYAQAQYLVRNLFIE